MIYKKKLKKLNKEENTKTQLKSVCGGMGGGGGGDKIAFFFTREEYVNIRKKNLWTSR